MGGALLSLVAVGVQDTLLTGNATVTFWKSVVRRHTPFAIESIIQTTNGTVGFSNRVTVVVSRNGDLLKSGCLEITLPPLPPGYSYVRGAGYRLMSEMHLEIGGQRIDTITSEWNEILHELTTPESKIASLDAMVGRDWTGRDAYGRFDVNGGNSAPDKIYVPLRFFFDNSPSLAIPLIALQYHQVSLSYQIADMASMIRWYDNSTNTWIVPPTMPPVSSQMQIDTFIDYVFLDTDERRRFATVSHELLITQMQTAGPEQVTVMPGGGAHNMRLNFNHPVKAIVWTSSLSEDTGSLDAFEMAYAPKQRGVRDPVTMDRAQYVFQVTATNAAGKYTAETDLVISTPLHGLVHVGDSIISNKWQNGATVTFVGNNLLRISKDSRIALAANESFEVLLHRNIFHYIGNHFAVATATVMSTGPAHVVVRLDNGETEKLIGGGATVYIIDNPSIAFTLSAVQGTSVQKTLSTNGTVPIEFGVGHRVVIARDMSHVTNLLQHKFSGALEIVDASTTADRSQRDVLPQNPVLRAMLTLNGHERFAERDGVYFEKMQPYMHAPRCPEKPIMMYSMGLDAFSHQPSGTTNFSRIDTAVLHLRFRDPANGMPTEMRNVTIYAINFNSLKILSGMAGLLFSN